MDWDDDEWGWDLGDPFHICHTCDGMGSACCPCTEEHVVVAHCFRCDDGLIECADCRGWGITNREI